MKFAHPNFLFALFLLVIPIIIHLFNFRKHKTLYFSNVKFLKKLNEQTKSVSKIKHWVILCLRMLTFAALILAFARPYIPENKNTDENESILAIYIDNSGSMEMMSNEGILLSKAISVAKNIVNLSPLKTRFLITDNNFAGQNQRIVGKSDAIDLIDEIKMSRKFKNIEAIYTQQNSFLKEKELDQQAQFIWISDFQKSTLKLPINIDSTSIQKIAPIKIQAIEQSNLFIDSVWFDSPVRMLKKMNQLNFRIKNTGSKPADGVSISFNKGGTKRSTSINVPANGESIGELSYTDKEIGVQKCQLTVTDKHVNFDDHFYFSYTLKNSLNISIISGENGTKKIGRLFELDTSNNVYETSEKQIDASKIASSNLIILNEIDNFSTGLQKTVSDFVEKGGSVCILPSLNMNINSFNSWLSTHNLPIFSNIKKEINVRSINYDNPFFNQVFYKKDAQINLPDLKNHYNLITSQNNRFHSLLSYGAEAPFFICSSDNKKSIFVASAGANKDFGNFGSHALFSTLMLRISELSYSKNPLYITPLTDQVIRVYTNEKKKNVLKAFLQQENIEFIPFQIQEGSLTELFINQTDAANSFPSGNYDILDEINPISSISLNTNSEESILETYSDEEISSLLIRSGFQNVEPILIENGENQVKIEFSSKKEYWRILLILALVFLALEIMVIKLIKN